MAEKKGAGKNKKALSPVITAIILVLLALVLASIILVWSRGFISEHFTKFDYSTNEEKPIEDSCVAVSLDASISGNDISFINLGNVPVHKIAINIISGGDSNVQVEEINLLSGAAITVTSSTSLAGKEIEVTPILLGKTESGETTAYTCDVKFKVVE